MAWFDAFAKHYDSWYQSKLGNFVDSVEKNLIEEISEFNDNEKVLDIGSGTGTFSVWMANKGLKVTGIDQSKEMIKVAQEKAEKENLEIDYVLGDAHKLPFADETFDLVVSVTAIEFVDDPKSVLKEAMRVLKPNGRLVIGALAKESPWGELYEELVEEDPNSLFAKAHFFTEEEIPSLLSQQFILKKGLYWPPIEEFVIDEAKVVESQKQQEQADNAGFFVIRWDKE